MQLRVDKLHRHLLLLHGRDDADDLDEHAHQHVHDRQRRQEDEDQEDERVQGAVVPDLEGHVGDVRHRAVEQQRRHGGRHVREVLLAQGRALQQAREEQREDVDDHQQQAEREEDRADRHGDAPDDHEHLRQRPHDAHQAAHAVQPHEPEEPQDAGVAQGDLVLQLHGGREDREDPRVQHEEEGQDGVEDEPEVPEAVPLPLEGAEANKPLAREEGTEQVLRHLEDGVGVAEQGRAVEVYVDGGPEGVESDHGERDRLEP
mmetsp:Transcript_59033/g.182932  ORF Transcript_59033/g.182932 Transcript_59033/m.182932 type:complete len:260 (-) Transcript_59033:4237-5016(-)